MSDEVVASFHYNLTALRLEYKTTSDALQKWSGGPAEEQDFLVYKKQELFRAMIEQRYHSDASWH